VNQYSVGDSARDGSSRPNASKKRWSSMSTWARRSRLTSFAIVPMLTVMERKLLGRFQARYGPNRVGPNLWNIVGSERGEGRGGFNFSAAMKAKGGKWTFDELNKFLANPRGYVPGTAMTYAGISKPEQRADVIDYLHTLSDNPVPLPKAAENAPAGGEQKK
jgi:hypothetical protein